MGLPTPRERHRASAQFADANSVYNYTYLSSFANLLKTNHQAIGSETIELGRPLNSVYNFHMAKDYIGKDDVL